MDIHSYVSSFSAIPTDWIIIAVLLGLATFDAFRAGTGKITTIALSSLLTPVMLEAARSAALFSTLYGSFSTPMLQAVLFAIVFVMLYFLLRRMTTDYALDGVHPLSAVIASSAAVAIVLVVWIHTSALQSLSQFGPPLQTLFGDPYRLWWMAGGLVVLTFTRD